MNARIGPLLVSLVLTAGPLARGDSVLVEAESFEQHGGWKLDTQFIEIMGSPYLLAHGLGRPVADATTVVEFPATGTYRVFVRTIDWVARWKAPGQPGRFQLLVDGEALGETFGTRGAEWFWHDGGRVEISKGKVRLSLRDLTGFDGRCDAILFTTDVSHEPPDDSTVLPEWRRRLLGLPAEPVVAGDYDLVVIGGGYSGMGAAISAARMGCSVALIQNRPVLGGNGSSEVRVWSNGLTRRGRFPRVGEIIEEFADEATKSPGRAEEFGDERKERIVRAEKNIDLYLDHHAYRVETEGERIAEVYAFSTRTGERRRFRGRLFADCTGHGTIGCLAGADHDVHDGTLMGMSNMWRWDEAKEPTAFPETPWALDLTMKDFPYPRDHHGQWFWESGFHRDPILDLEAIRDWNLRAVYGAFNAMKNRDGARDHEKAILTWVAFIGGPRESRRLLGDVVLTSEDIVGKKQFPDGCVPSTWSIDLHYPKKQYAGKYPENPFISVAVHDRRIDRAYGYPVPYRCFYSRNVPNLFMAGRCISVTHEALGTTRVMKTCGMMGEVVGKAAWVCVTRDCLPRDVYVSHWSEMEKLLRLPGKARRTALRGEIVVPADALPEASPFGPMTGVDPRSLGGIVVDDRDAAKTGKWTRGTGLAGYVGWNYLYAARGSDSSIRFELTVPDAGRYELRLAYRNHANRATNVPVRIVSPAGTRTVNVNMRVAPPLPGGLISIGACELGAGEKVTVELSTEKVDGFVHADAVQALAVVE